jgi:hypothetical protein
MNLAALDLGTTCGWARLDPTLTSGVWQLGPRDFYRCPDCNRIWRAWVEPPPAPRARARCACGGRWVREREPWGIRFTNFMDALEQLTPIDWILYEEVEFNPRKGFEAPQIWGGFCALLLHWCTLHDVGCRGVSVGTIKKSWTGRGDASKDAMLAEAQRRGHAIEDHNQADALALLDYGRTHLVEC